MRKWLIFICVCILGLLALYIGRFGDQTSPADRVSMYAERESLMLSVDDVAMFENRFGNVTLRIREIQDNCVFYDWHFRAVDSKDELSGMGAAKSRKVTVGMPNDATAVLDYGSDEFLNTGKMRILWSPNTSTSVWVYFNPSITTVEVDQAAGTN